MLTMNRYEAKYARLFLAMSPPLREPGTRKLSWNRTEQSRRSVPYVHEAI